MDSEGDDDQTASGVDPRLAKLFDENALSEELETWSSMPPARREKALKRIAALDRYTQPGSDLPAKTAAVDAGVKLGRFYQMARAWRQRPSLASLGAYAEASKVRERFDATVVNAIQKAVRTVVKDNATSSVAEQTRLLATAIAGTGKKVPGTNTLRVFVERERRRVRETGLAGHELLFDCTLTSIEGSGDSSFTAFLIIDDGTGLVLGHAVGDAADSVAGYRAAAADAVRRMDGSLGSAAIWSSGVERSQLVPGEDREAVGELVGRLRSNVGGYAPQMLGPNRYGAYLRGRVGLKVGPVRFLPARTQGRVVPTDGFTAAAVAYAWERLELWVAARNEELLSAMARHGAPTPPAALINLLGAMASDQIEV